MAKWIEARPEEPAAEVARRALADRLARVAFYLGPAATEPEKDIEHVHQLRVASRRAGSALTVFAPLLPKRRAKEIGRVLKEIRRAAGDARDADVLIERLRARGEAPAVIRHVEDRRADAQPAIVEIRSLCEDDEVFSAQLDALLARVGRRDKAGQRFDEFAGAALRPVVEAFLAESPARGANLDAIHEFRIRGKALRYALELLANAFPSALKTELYGDVELLQELLGDLNDHVTAIRTYRDRKAGGAAETGLALDALIETEKDALLAVHDRFFAWWTPERAGELARRFQVLIDG